MPRTAHLVSTDYSALDRPTVLRRSDAVPWLTENMAGDIAHHHGVTRWEDIDEATRADMRAILQRHYVGRLLHARAALKAGATLANAERVARLERGLAAARRLP